MLETLKIYFLPCMINIVTGIYLLCKFFKVNIKFNSFKLYFAILLFVFISILNFIYVNNLIRVIIMTLCLAIFSHFILNVDLKTSIVGSIIVEFIVMISETIVTVFILFFSNYNSVEIINNFYGNILTNILISLIMILIGETKLVIKAYTKIIQATNKINIKMLLLFSLCLVLTINIIFFTSFYNDIKLFYINLLFIFLYSFIFYMALNIKNQNIEFKERNETLIKNLSEYEKMLDYQRVNNHENKNQLLVIKSMIEKKDEKTLDYINEIIKDKREDNEILYTKAKRIPSGGLQGLIYQKMLLGQENKIRFNLNVSKDIRKIDIFEENSKLNYDICRIIGIVLDNAIEEVIKLSKQEREILISMYIDEYFIIEVSNHFIGDIDFDKIYNKGYTTKSKGHGYGLSLLKEIVGGNENIINEKQILDNIFTQIIKIKM